jgi:guanosine-3',5'-bis(diphosphate) 3'-pyrophosphohydrolase
MPGGDNRSAIVEEARRLAAEEHAGQERKATAKPYSEHVGEVAELVERSGFDDEVVAAALLHDLIEHTPVELGDVRKRFGERVGEMVAAMTDRDEIDSWEERKAEHRERVAAAGRDAAVIYAADKTCGIRESRAGYAEVAEAVEERLGTPVDVRIRAWEADIDMLRRVDPRLPLLGELERELEGLREDRVARAGAEGATRRP